MSTNDHVPIICLVGYHNSGKTTLGAKIVQILKTSGLKVGVIKSTKEMGIDFDNKGTDTHNYSRSGADQVALVAPDQMVFQAKRSDMDLPALAQTFFAGFDIVIAEGFKHTPSVPKIEVNRTGVSYLYPHLDNVVAVVSECKQVDIKHFSPTQPDEIAEFITAMLL